MITNETVEDMLIRCMRCPDMCACFCPVFVETKNQAVTPSHMTHAAFLYSKGILPGDAKLIETMYQCIGCRRCVEMCMYDDIDNPGMLAIVRNQLTQTVDESLLPEFVRKILEGVRATGFPYGQYEGRQESVELDRYNSTRGTVLYFAGCATRYFQPEISSAALNFFSDLGEEVQFYPEDEPCCGGPLFDAGLLQEGAKLANQVKAFIQESGCKTVVSNCPRCVSLLKTGYPHLGIDLGVEILHLTEMVAAKVAEGKVSFADKPEINVALDDDPYMARALHVLDQPRTILNAISGVNLVEMPSNREMANPGTCYLELPDADISRKIVQNRLLEAQSTNVEVLVTTSPMCKKEMSGLGQTSFKIQDIIELVQERRA